MLESLLVWLIYAAVVVLIAYIANKLLTQAGMPAMVQQIVWLIAFLICAVLLLDAFNIGTGDLDLNNNR